MHLQNNIYIPTRSSIILNDKDAFNYILNYLSNSTRSCGTEIRIRIRSDDLVYSGMRRVI